MLLHGHRRVDLGDWRDNITWQPDIFDDINTRSVFYEERGFDPSSTDFPPEAFEEGVRIARLKEPPPILAEDYDIPAQDSEEEIGFTRTNAAHNRLQRFETQVRRFIDERLTAAFGENWIDSRIPDTMRQEWIDKRDRARPKDKKDRPLIAYADFTDYERIICQKGNWKSAFKPVFRRDDFVRESLQRLYPIRICTMHARLITQDDELYLYVEVKRFLSAIDDLKH